MQCVWILQVCQVWLHRHVPTVLCRWPHWEWGWPQKGVYLLQIDSYFCTLHFLHFICIGWVAAALASVDGVRKSSYTRAWFNSHFSGWIWLTGFTLDREWWLMLMFMWSWSWTFFVHSLDARRTEFKSLYVNSPMPGDEYYSTACWVYDLMMGYKCVYSCCCWTHRCTT